MCSCRDVRYCTRSISTRGYSRDDFGLQMPYRTIGIWSISNYSCGQDRHKVNLSNCNELFWFFLMFYSHEIQLNHIRPHFSAPFHPCSQPTLRYDFILFQGSEQNLVLKGVWTHLWQPHCQNSRFIPTSSRRARNKSLSQCFPRKGLHSLDLLDLLTFLLRFLIPSRLSTRNLLFFRCATSVG